jgi:ubiquinone biosynthesis protein UbiJ
MEAIRARLDAVTPWRYTFVGCSKGDAEFMASAADDIAWLLDEVDALRERVAILRADLEDLEDMADARGGDA